MPRKPEPPARRNPIAKQVTHIRPQVVQDRRRPGPELCHECGGLGKKDGMRDCERCGGYGSL